MWNNRENFHATKNQIILRLPQTKQKGVFKKHYTKNVHLLFDRLHTSRILANFFEDNRIKLRVTCVWFTHKFGQDLFL